jgi:hypothetical protein
MALKEGCKELVYINTLFEQVPGLSTLACKTLLTDSQSAIDLAKNPVFHQRTKHIQIHYHYVRECALNGDVNLKHCPTNQMLADPLTKAIADAPWQAFVDNIGLRGDEGEKSAHGGVLEDLAD